MRKFCKLLSIFLLVLFSFVNTVPFFVMSASALSDKLDANNTDTQGIIFTLNEKTSTSAVSDTTSVTISGNIVIPDIVTKNGKQYRVTEIEAYAFYNCTSLTEVVIPDSVIVIEDAAFRNCSSITKITLPKNVRIIEEETFYDCTSLKTVNLPAGITDIYDKAFFNCESLPSIILPESTLKIGTDAFKYCDNLEEITFPERLTEIGGNAFYNCKKISQISIPNSVISIGRNAFLNTGWYKNQPDGLIYLNKIVYKYKGTMPANTTITLKNDTKIIADEAFSRCRSLIFIKVPDSLARIGNAAFINCTALSNIMIPDSVSHIGASAFFGCEHISAIELPDKLSEIYDYTFNECTSLVSVTIPAGVKKISKSAFSNLQNLTLNVFSNTCAYRYAVDNGISYRIIGTAVSDWNVTFTNSIAHGIIEGSTLSEITEKVGSALTAKNLAGEKISGDSLVGTGYIINYNGADYTVIVKGDVNGDGNVNSRDYLIVKRTILGTLNISEVQKKAACLSETDYPTARDYLKIKRHFLGIYNIYDQN